MNEGDAVGEGENNENLIWNFFKKILNQEEYFGLSKE